MKLSLTQKDYHAEISKQINQIELAETEKLPNSQKCLIILHIVGWEIIKPVLSSHSKIAKTKVLKTNGSLMKVKSIAESSFGAFLVFFLSGRSYCM